MEVKEIQRALNRNGYRVVEDGVMGPETDGAVRQFQAKSGLLVDGVVGPKTGSHLGMYDTAFTKTKRERPMSPADQIVRSLAAARQQTGSQPEFTARVKDKIREEEGFGRPGREGYVYKDTKGLPTVGYGFNLADSGLRGMIDPEVISGRRPMSKDEAEGILDKRLPSYVNAAKVYAGEAWDTLSDDQKIVLIDMHYNMGNKARFPKMGEAIQAGDFNRASMELMDSDYARKDAPNRAKRNAELIKKSLNIK